MTLPLPGAVLVKRRHRALDEGALRELLAEQLKQLPERLVQGADRLRRAREQAVASIESALVDFLDRANLPRRYLQALTTAYAAEPSATAFGIAQAATRAAQGMNPEVRFELERAAGRYLAEA